jgi:hypothetical protein
VRGAGGHVGILITFLRMRLKKKRQSSPVTGLQWPRGFLEVKVPRFHDNGTGWW